MTITASIVGPTFLTVMINATTHTVNQDHANYTAIREALKAKDHDLVEQLINVAKSIVTFVAGRVRIEGDQVFYGEFEVKGSIVQRIINMMREGFDAQPMINFLENLMNNPSKRAVDELYGFLEVTSLPITEDGCFLAYKKVRDDYKDFYTGKMDNSVGVTLEMPRNQVDENKDSTCSYGLHFCSMSYLPHYHGGEGRVMIVKINPQDVVAVPSDYANAKGRACRYEIIGEHVSELTEAFTSSVYRNNTPIDPNDDDDDDCDDDSDETEWQAGHDAGTAKAALDSQNYAVYNDYAASNQWRSLMFCEGFTDGYHDEYHVVWSDLGYNNAQNDVETSAPYNDVPPAACGDAGEYLEGYANGWRDAKVSRI